MRPSRFAAAGPATPPSTNLVWNLDYRLDAYSDAGTTPVLDGEDVVQWDDQTGGQNFTSSGSTSDGVYDDDAGVVFTNANSDAYYGSVQYLSSPPVPSDTSGIYFAIYKPVSLPSPRTALVSFARTNSGTSSLAGTIETGGNISIGQFPSGNRVSGTTTTISAGNWYSLVWLSTGTAYGLWVNGVEQAKSVLLGSDDGDWIGDGMSGPAKDVLGANGGSGTPNGREADGTVMLAGRYSAYDADVLTDLNAYLADQLPS
jgi:hypothetical protein